MKRALGILALACMASCSKRVNFCESDKDCADPAFPFCDVDGQYAPSGGVANTCTIVPPDCPIDRCGCSPGVVMCAMGTLQTCNPDGMSVTMQACALGCGSGGTTCATFVPSNSLATALASAASASLVSIPSGATIDTDAGTVAGTTVASTVVMVQNSSMRVFAAPSWTLPNLRITGSLPVAFVASGQIQVQGFVELESRAGSDGAGADTAIACHGANVMGGGGGGGGGGTSGGAGSTGVGGKMATGFSPLLGGCAGGMSVVGNGGFAGDGGGAIQLVSSTDVSIAGVLDVSGAGGGSSAGGGAGGTVIIESPTVEITSGGIAADGGGGGGACGLAGADGGSGDVAAPGGTCSPSTNSGGNGGAGTIAAQNGVGGGGAVGRARIATGSGSFEQGAETVMSVAVTNDTLVPN